MPLAQYAIGPNIHQDAIYRSIHVFASRDGWHFVLPNVAPANLSLVGYNDHLPVHTIAFGSNVYLLPPLLLWWLKALSDRLNHLAKPIEVQSIKNNVTAQVGKSQPERDKLLTCKLHNVIMDRHGRLAGSCCAIVQGIIVDSCPSWLVVDCGPDILVNADGLVGTPNETAREEGDEK